MGRRRFQMALIKPPHDDGEALPVFVRIFADQTPPTCGAPSLSAEAL